MAVSSLLSLFQPTEVQATNLGARTLTLLAPTTPFDDDDVGGSQPSNGLGTEGTANHQFTIDIPTSTNVDTIRFEYCTTAAAVPGGIDCDVPTGVDASGASVGVGAGSNGDTDWTISSQTATTLVLDGTAEDMVGVKTFLLEDVINPDGSACATTDPNCTFFVRITTYDGGTGGTEIDSGTVAAATALQIELEGTMPESLVFCVGQEITEDNDVPDCSSVTTGNVSFNKLFTPEDAAWATSQMAASTNAVSGYIITVNGPTMTSGLNTISAIGAAGVTSAPGTSQFGMNVVENDEPNTVNPGNPAVSPASADVTEPLGNTLHNGTATGDYSTGGNDATALFAFLSGNTVANSGGAASDSQVFTATYIVNVPGSQPAGTYNSTLTYICTPTF